MKRTFQKIFTDLKKGENIDLYLMIIISIILSLLSLLGYAAPAIVSSVTLATLAVLANHSLRDRYNAEQIIAKIKKVADFSNENSVEISTAVSRLRNSQTEFSMVVDKLSDMDRGILSRIEISRSIDASGLLKIEYQSRNIDWDHYFHKANEIDLFFTYGRTWRNANENLIDKFVRRSGTRLRVILPDPRKNDVLTELSNRFAKKEEEFELLIKEAEEAYKNFKQTALRNGSDVEVWLATVTPMYTLYRFDGKVIIGLSSFKSTKGNVPHFIASPGGMLHNFAIEEFDVLLNQDNLRKISRRLI